MSLRLLAGAAAAVALTATSLAVAAPASAAGTAKASDTVVIDCAGKKVVKPKEIVLTCADAGVGVFKISWQRWGMNAAIGTGTLSWNTCLPKNCADGTVLTYPVRIRLSRLASGPGVTAFTRMKLAFPEGGPALAQTARYTLDNRLAD